MGISVIHDQDGHVDDLLTCLLLWLSPAIDLQAIGITNGDCFLDQAFQSMIKIATYLDLEGAEIALSEEAPTNSFPQAWREESFIINDLALFRANDLKKPYAQGRPRKSDVLFADCLQHSKAPITILTTGPLTNIARLLKNHPHLKQKIESLVIVGGALKVPGNVQVNGFDGTAEWNIFADPVAFKTVLESKLAIKLIPLDLTSQLAIPEEFLARLHTQAKVHMVSNLASSLWSIVQTFQSEFCDMVGAAAVINPSLLKFKEMRINVSTSGKNMGRTWTSLLSGRKVQVAIDIDRPAFESLVLSILRSR